MLEIQQNFLSGLPAIDPTCVGRYPRICIYAILLATEDAARNVGT